MDSRPESGRTARGSTRAILSAFADRRITIAGLWLLGLASIGLSLVMPVQVGRLTQLFAGGETASWPPVLWAIVSLVAAQLGLSAIGFVQTWSEVSLRESAVRNLTLRLYGRILRFGADFFRNQEVERINARAIENANRVCMFWGGALVTAPLAAGSLLVVGAAMVLDHWLLGVCMIVLSALSGYFALFDRRIQAANAASRDAWESIRAGTSEVVAGVAEIRHHHAFAHALESLARPFRAYQKVMERCGRMMAMFQAMDPLVATIQKGALLAVGAALCIAGSSLARVSGPMTWGRVITFLLLAQVFQESVGKLASCLLQWRMTRESERRVADYLSRPCAFTDTAGRPPAEEPVGVAYEGLSVVTDSGRPILRDVTLTVPPGSHVALCGPSGCGKSTLLGALVRGVVPSAGRCRLGEASLEEYSPAWLARCVGLVPQGPVLFNTSVRQNLLLSLRRGEGRCLHDAEGPLDVERLPHVTGLKELDAELVAAVTLVGLDADLVCKCLDAPLGEPAGAGAAVIRAKLDPLRQRLAQQVRALPEGTVLRFDRGLPLPGTVGENLLGPGAAVTAGQVARLGRWLQGQPAMDDLLRIGHGRILAEPEAAMRVGMSHPELLERLSELPAAAAGTGRTLAALAVEERQLLLAAAMPGEVEEARELAGPGDFTGRLLAARASILRQDSGAGAVWEALEGRRAVEGLALRENLLGGRPDGRRHGAAARVDEMILAAVREEGLWDAAVLAGLEFVVGEGGRFLSGGQRQKVAIARIVLKNPSLLLLDEATASLDESSQARIVELVRTRFAGRTVVSISHRLDTVREYDDVVVMDRGQVVQQGRYDDLAAREGLFRTLVRQEQGGPPEAAPAPEPSVAAPAETPLRQLQHAVAGADLFRGLTSEPLAALTKAMRVVRCPAGEVLFRRGDAGAELYVILDGRVEFFVDRPADGADVCTVVNAMPAGGLFGELAAFGGGRRTVGARAAEETTLGILRRDDLVAVIHAHPGVAVELLGAVSGYLVRAADAAYEAPAPRVA